MRVQVKLFATLHRYAVEGHPGTPFEVDLPEGASLQELVDQLKIPQEQTKIAFVNGEIRSMDWVLKPDDEVGIFPPIGGGMTAEIRVDTWLYGDLARYGGQDNHGSYANLQVDLPEGSTLRELLAYLQISTEARGITFINGVLSALPGMQPDLDHTLQDGDRVAFFHLGSMWPFQYRFGVPMIGELSEEMRAKQDQSLRHSYRNEEDKK